MGGSDNFSLFVHHGGEFREVQGFDAYGGGKKVGFHDLDVDKFGFFDLKDLVESLGYSGWAKLVHVKPKSYVFRVIKTDKEVMDMLGFLTDVNRVVSVFVEGEIRKSDVGAVDEGDAGAVDQGDAGEGEDDQGDDGEDAEGDVGEGEDDQGDAGEGEDAEEGTYEPSLKDLLSNLPTIDLSGGDWVLERYDGGLTTDSEEEYLPSNAEESDDADDDNREGLDDDNREGLEDEGYVAVKKKQRERMGTSAIAWGVVSVENEVNWSWFVKHLVDDLEIGSGENYTFISDQQKGLMNVVRNYAPRAEHRNCARHIYMNWKKDNKGATLKIIFWKAVRATTEQQYKKVLEEMKAESVGAY
ncbi:uncharacterized protein LOC131008500 [Salvia miltiorrhiza]|uniref:uncharacterized protein LOC131008500 n=1 Tax=Salvia miltiorrhiza TaxID=226208 RepID=UPI0025ABC986|nr:uncharacterized protein LOC131008500 [Salvia miltiorrhiza]